MFPHLSPSSVSLILLLYPYLSHFSLPSIGSFPLFHQGRGYISSYPAPSLSPTLSVSLFSSISPSFSLIFLRDNCVQALSSFSSLKRRLPSRHREADSAFQSSMMSRTHRPPPTSKTLTHSHNKSSTTDKIRKWDTTNNYVCLSFMVIMHEGNTHQTVPYNRWGIAASRISTGKHWRTAALTRQRDREHKTTLELE